jgi:hypothetical protein
MFEKALKKSSLESNLVFTEAKKLLEKGYRKEEIVLVLQKLHTALIDESEERIVKDACTNIDELE